MYAALLQNSSNNRQTIPSNWLFQLTQGQSNETKFNNNKNEISSNNNINNKSNESKIKNSSSNK